MAGEASRANGKKGGRPRKHPRANPPVREQKPTGKWALTRREELFVHQLVTFPEKTQGQCYIDAGYRAKSKDIASANAGRLIKVEKVARALAAARQTLSERHKVTQDRVLLELGRIGFADLRKMFAMREVAAVTPEHLYDACRNPEWTLPFEKLSAADQAAWTAAAERASASASGGYFLKTPDQLDDDTAAALASIEVVTRNIGDGEVEHIHKVKTVDKLGALTTMARHLGMLKESGEKPNPVPLFALPAEAEPDISDAARS